jgi:hypothetical protein
MIKNCKQVGPTLSKFPSASKSITRPIYSGTTKVPAELRRRNTTPKKNKQDSVLAYRSIYLNDAFFCSFVRSGTVGGFTASKFGVTTVVIGSSSGKTYKASPKFVDVRADWLVWRCIW